MNEEERRRAEAEAAATPSAPGPRDAASQSSSTPVGGPRDAASQAASTPVGGPRDAASQAASAPVGGPRDAASQATDGPVGGPRDAASRGKVLTFPRVALYAVPLALAAALAFVLLRPGADPLPAYTFEARGTGSQEWRGAVPTAPAITLAPGAPFEFVLRPADAAPDAALAAFVVRDGGAAPWTIPVERVANGSMRVAGTFGDGLRLEPGELRLAFVVARAADLPGADAVRDAVAGGAVPAGAPWQLFVQPVRVAP